MSDSGDKLQDDGQMHDSSPVFDEGSSRYEESNMQLQTSCWYVMIAE